MTAKLAPQGTQLVHHGHHRLYGRGYAHSARQRGAVLFISLIVLVAMTMAGIALMRSVDTGSLIAGNLALRSAATNAADAGIESARIWLTGQTAASLNDDGAAGSGYYANWQGDFDPWTTPVFWRAVGSDPLSNVVDYVVHRMCEESAKSVDTTRCSKVSTTSVGSTKTGGAYGAGALSGASLVYYRITVRVTGPKNTRSYIQAFTY